MPVLNGTTYHEETSPEMMGLLERIRTLKWRVRFHWGDAKTGLDWGDEYDVEGKIGRSMGPSKIPILIEKPSDDGGPAISDNSIVKIVCVKDKAVLYQHPSYHTREDRPEELPEVNDLVQLLDPDGTPDASLSFLSVAKYYLPAVIPTGKNDRGGYNSVIAYKVKTDTGRIAYVCRNPEHDQPHRKAWIVFRDIENPLDWQAENGDLKTSWIEYGFLLEAIAKTIVQSDGVSDRYLLQVDAFCLGIKLSGCVGKTESLHLYDLSMLAYELGNKAQVQARRLLRKITEVIKIDD